MFKKNITLVPSVWSKKALADIINFVDFYKEDFEVVIICDLYEEEMFEKDGVKYVTPYTPLARYYTYMSEYVIDAGTLNRHSKISQDQVRVSVWHGVPYKKMFIDYNIKNLYSALNYQRGYDYMISSSKFYSEKFLKNSMMYGGKILELGTSKMDSNFKTEIELKNLKKDFGIEKKIVLYVPTFREKGKISLPFDAEKLLDNIGDEYVLLVKLHYLNELKKINNDRVIDVTNYDNIGNLLSISDVVISDYSSVIFDYSLFNRPLILFQYDFEEYNEDRSFMFDINEYVPKEAIVCNCDELYERVANLPDYNLDHMKEVFYPLEDGNATQRIVEKIDFKPEVREIKEIIFLVNDLNQIGGIHNFVHNTAKIFKERYNARIILIGINEFSETNEQFHLFESEYVDVMVSKAKSSLFVRTLLENTTGIIISLQFSAHLSMQKHMADKNVILMFHGDVKDIIDRTHYKWHLDSLNTTDIYNYKKFLLLSKSNMDLIKDHLDRKENIGYIENSFNFNQSSLYSKSGVFVAITRFDTDKNIYDLLKIFKSDKLDKDYILHIYGDGPLFEMFKYKLKELKLEKKVILKGYCNDKKIMFNNKQGLISTSLTEGMPIIFLEAINYGIPIYSYNSFTAVGDMINDKIGKLVKRKKINEYVEALNEKFEYNFENFIEASYQYSPEVIGEKWDDIFKDIENENSIKHSNRESILKKIPRINWNTTKNSMKKKYRKMPMRQKVIVLNSYNFLYEICTTLKMKEKPLVSIVIPYYDKEESIYDTLKSIYKQKYKNVEIIVVNDGSKLDSEKLLKKFPNIKYYYKDNEGVGLARNYGIDRATGKYLFFLDPDDTIPRGAISSLVNAAEKYKLNVVAGKVTRIKFEDRLDRHIWFYSIYKENYINYKNERVKLLSDTLSTNKIYNLEELRKADIRFEKGLYEDKIFIAKIYNYFEKIGIINKHVYNWYVYGEGTSITTTLTLENFYERLKRMYEIMEISDEKEKFFNFGFAINHDFKIYLNSFNSFNEDEKRKIFDSIYEYDEVYGKFYYPRNIVNIFNLEYYEAVRNNDYERFYKLSTINSNILLEEDL